FSAKATSPTSTAIGMNAKASATGAVAIGAGSQATEKNTVSFGYTSTTGDVYREIVMIAEGTTDTSAVNLKQLKDALGVGDGVTAINEQMMREQYAGTNYIVTDSLTKDGTNLIEVDKVLDAQIKVNADAIALKANAADVYTKTETDNTFATKTALEDKADKADTLSGYGIKDAYTKTEVDSLLGGSSAAIAGINQRIDRTNAKINEVGAGAAALAALHPLDYDPDDKLTFSAGMGNYAGENAAALGAFYRPNEKFMVSLGGTMGNGENMVNLGLSIGLDKPNGLAKLSKRELIQKVNAVEAENDALGDRVAKLEALVAQLASK
ncbi:MAG: YadA-like family protein, partial [Phascolarctobacterium sp.]|nr:YadA-like family protein [Phascolarctobacterium sp.]